MTIQTVLDSPSGCPSVFEAGLPGIAVPAGLSDEGLPLGLKLIGRPFDEEMLFRTGQVIEDAAGRFTPQAWW